MLEVRGPLIIYQIQLLFQLLLVKEGQLVITLYFTKVARLRTRHILLHLLRLLLTSHQLQGTGGRSQLVLRNVLALRILEPLLLHFIFGHALRLKHQVIFVEADQIRSCRLLLFPQQRLFSALILVEPVGLLIYVFLVLVLELFYEFFVVFCRFHGGGSWSLGWCFFGGAAHLDLAQSFPGYVVFGVCFVCEFVKEVVLVDHIMQEVPLGSLWRI